MKNLLVYADGRVEDARYELEGVYFIKSEMVDGDLWQRTFEVHAALAGDPKDPERITARTMVGIERNFELKRTRAQLAEDDAKRRAETMKRALWGIANYPGDDGDGG